MSTTANVAGAGAAFIVPILYSTPAFPVGTAAHSNRAFQRSTRMKIRTRDFRVPAGDRLRLGKWPTRVPPVYETKDDYDKMLARHVSRLSALQELLYAS